MTKKQYFIRRGNFGNVYDLAWADNKEDCRMLEEMGFERESRKHAEHNARMERWRRKYDQSCSGYADESIYPAKYYTPEVQNDWQGAEMWLYHHNYELKGVIWE